MTDNENAKAMDILEKHEFFGGQRAGRELWSKKPVDVQDRDVEDFAKDIAYIKDLINRQKAEIERLQCEIKEKTETIVFLKDQVVGWSIDFRNIKNKVETAKAEAIKEFAERLKKEVAGWYYDFADFDDTMDALTEIDNLVKEMTEETKHE